MDLKEIAKLLGMSEESTAEEVMAMIAKLVEDVKSRENKADEAVKTAEEGVKENAAVAASLKGKLAEHGIALSADLKTVKKVEALGTEILPGDSEQIKELKKTIAEGKLHNGVARINKAKELMSKFVGEKKLVPPAVAESLEKLLTIGDQAEALSLSADGQSLERTAIDLSKELVTVLNAIPAAMNAQGLSRVSGETADEKKKRGEDKAAVKDIVARAQGRKKVAAK